MPSQTYNKPPSAPNDDSDLAYDLACKNLGEGTPGVEILANGERAEFALFGITYACVERIGRVISLTFLVDAEDHAVAASLPGYEPDAVRTGWLKLRLGKDPHRWRDARVSAFVGRTLARLRAVAEIGRWKSLAGSESPYAVVAASLAPRWAEDATSADAADADRATETSLLARPWGSVVVLGRCSRLYFTPLENGGLFVRVVGVDGISEPELRTLVTEVPETAFEPSPLEFEVVEPWLAFPTDARRLSGGATHTLSCELAPGRYQVDSATLAPSPRLRLALTRFLRVKPTGRTAPH